jgi:predicted phosphodiesterase
MRVEMLNDLREYVNTYGDIDHLFICGDIAYKGEKAEYDNAKIFIKNICDTIRCKESEVYVVPGNHDKRRKGNSEHIRKCLHKGLADEKSNEDLLQDLLNKEFSLLKTLHRSFKDYAEFGSQLFGVDPLMLKCTDPGNDKTYNHDTDMLYWRQELGDGLDSYKIMLYGMNSALCSDEQDFNGESGHGGHKLFLSKLAYNIPNLDQNTVNILMAHHPLTFLTSQMQVKKIIDKKFKIQFYGHVHLPKSDNNTAIHIHSGALQPHEGGEDKKFFPVYNIVEIDIAAKDKETDILSVKLMVQKWNKGSAKFEEYTEESTTYTLPLEHKNRWTEKNETQNARPALPEGVSKRDVMIKFQGYKNRKKIIKNIYPDAYDENISSNSNCIHFLARVEQSNDWDKLWNEIKD